MWIKWLVKNKNNAVCYQYCPEGNTYANFKNIVVQNFMES